MTRIVSGALGGRRIEVPAGSSTRPTSERVRESVFGRLVHQDAVAGLAALDLYAGSGALGLEALSRGAVAATFVESDRACASVLRRNVAALLPDDGTGSPRVVAVLAEPVERVLLRGADRPYDLVLADPPYALSEDGLADMLALLTGHGWLAPDACVVIERAARSLQPRWPSGLRPVDERRYGDTRVWWARAGEDPQIA